MLKNTKEQPEDRDRDKGRMLEEQTNEIYNEVAEIAT